MAITVTDIEQKEFVYKGQGYDPYDVDTYLDQICDEMIALEDRVKQLEGELAKARQDAENAAKAVLPVKPDVVRAEPAAGVEQTSAVMQSILVNAQKLADTAVADARREAAEIVKAAQDKAEGLVGNAKEERALLEKGMASMQTAAQEFRGKFMALLDEQKALLETKLTQIAGK